MNIGLVTTWYERGAAYVSRQYRDALMPEHEVFVFARGQVRPPRGSPWNQSFVTWDTDPAITARYGLNLHAFERWLRRERIDLVFFNEERKWDAIRLCNRLGILTGAYVDYYTEETIPLFGIYDFLVCNTKRHYSVFDWHPQVFYVPWGTDTALFAPREPALRPVTEGETVFFHSCGYSPRRKGTDLLLQAFAVLPGAARLVIHAQCDLPKRLPAQAGLIEELTSAGRLTVHMGDVTAPGLYHLGDVYVYPARLDGIGLTVPEAISCGLPAIVPDEGPMNEFVEPGRSGAVVPVAKRFARYDGYYWPQCEVDIGKLAAAMEPYAARHDALAHWKQAARGYASQLLDWRRNASGLAAAFGSVSALPPADKAAAERKIQVFETRLPWSRLSQRLRWAYRTYRFLNGPFRSQS